MSLNTFIEENVEPGSTIVTDAWRSNQSIDKERYAHIERNQPKRLTKKVCCTVFIWSLPWSND